jgi:hypothetical protein
MVAPTAHSVEGSLGSPRISGVLSTSQRWQSLSKSLLLEADEWGRDERGCRSPTGGYLELLARTAIPAELANSLNHLCCRFGVIDVVITHGRSSQSKIVEDLDLPSRKLPEQKSVELRVSNKDHAAKTSAMTLTEVALNDPKSPRISTSLSTEASMNLGVSKSPSPFDLSVVATGTAADLPALSMAPTTASSNLSSKGKDAHPSADCSEFVRTREPAARTVVPTEKPHPGRPKVVPQKRYRGSEPDPQSRPSAKRQKTTNPLEELPFDVNTPTSMCTRAKRNGSTSFVEVSLPTKSTVSRKKKEDNATPLTPKKDRSSINPKTPRSGSPTKKKARTLHYNPKYSNRPQNLRRKNSAGEWFTPTKPQRRPSESDIGSTGAMAKLDLNNSSQRSASTPSKSNEHIQTLPNGTVSQGSNTMTESFSREIFRQTVLGSLHLNDVVQGVPNAHNDASVFTATNTGIEDIKKVKQNTENESEVARNQTEPKRKSLRLRFFLAAQNTSKVAGNGKSDLKVWCIKRIQDLENIPQSINDDQQSQDRRLDCSMPEDSGFIDHTSKPDPILPISATSVIEPKTGSLVNITAKNRRKSASQKPRTNLGMASATLSDACSKLSPQTQDHSAANSRPSSDIAIKNAIDRVKRLTASVEKTAKRETKTGSAVQAVSLSSPKSKALRGRTVVQQHHKTRVDVKNGFSPAAPMKDLQLTNPQEPTSINRVDIPTSEVVQNSNRIKTNGASIGNVLQNKKTSTPNNVSVGEGNPKPHCRQSRMVGASELKALLENHPPTKDTNTSFGSAYEAMDTQLMTRASKKAIAYAPAEKASFDKFLPTTRRASNTRGLATSASSKMAISKSNVPSTPNKPLLNAVVINGIEGKRTKNTSGGVSQATDVRTERYAGTARHSHETRRASFRGQKEREGPQAVLTKTINPIRLVDTETPAGPHPARKMKQPVSRRQKLSEAGAANVKDNGVDLRTVVNDTTTPAKVPPTTPIRRPATRRTKETFSSTQTDGSADARPIKAPKVVNTASKEVGKAKDETVKAADNLKRIIRTKVQPVDGEVLHLKDENTTTSEMENKAGTLSKPLTVEFGSSTWTPNTLCDDSVLTYAEAGHFPGLDMHPATGLGVRKVAPERDGYFKAIGVLLGVRYVVGV